MWKLFTLLLVLAPPLVAQATRTADSDRVRILSLENAWNQAVHQKDAAAMSILLGAELVYVDFDGKLMGKAEYLASVRSQTLRPERVVSEFMTVHVYGAVAVVTGLYRESGETNRKPYTLRERFTDTWIRQNDSWLCVASQSTLANP